MSELLDPHSEDYDPERFLEIADNQRKAAKEGALSERVASPQPDAASGVEEPAPLATSRSESALDAVIPPARRLYNPFTGEILDRDDLPALRKALAEIDEFLNAQHDKHRRLHDARYALRARIGELEPTDLPRRRDQTEAQKKIDRCPKCRTRLPRVVVEEAE